MVISRQPTGYLNYGRHQTLLCGEGAERENFGLFSDTTGLHISTKHGLKIQERVLERWFLG